VFMVRKVGGGWMGGGGNGGIRGPVAAIPAPAVYERQGGRGQLVAGQGTALGGAAGMGWGGRQRGGALGELDF